MSGRLDQSHTRIIEKDSSKRVTQSLHRKHFFGITSRKQNSWRHEYHRQLLGDPMPLNVKLWANTMAQPIEDTATVWFYHSFVAKISAPNYSSEYPDELFHSDESRGSELLS